MSLGVRGGREKKGYVGEGRMIGGVCEQYVLRALVWLARLCKMIVKVGVCFSIYTSLY